VQPLAVLDWRISAISDATKTLVQWQDLYPEDAT